MNYPFAPVTQALEKRGFETHTFSTSAQARDFLLAQIPKSARVGVGGSESIRQSDIVPALRQRNQEVYWHWDVAHDARMPILQKAMTADVYLCSVNALCENGILVQTDGTGNRIGAMCYGPQCVYLLVGRNKLVHGGINDAIARIKRIACPKNARRLNLSTPCALEGTCRATTCTQSMCAITAHFDRAPGAKRTVVLLVDEDLGF